ncbi:MAG: AEC family transporter [Verrucomicrobia bacterium]|nr:MAG: AEC family transporter [Verrucomicrobiota bacterium]
MITPFEVIIAVLPVYLLILAGGVLRKLKVILPEHDAGVMRVVLAVMLPCYILDTILGSEVLRKGGAIASAVAIGFSGILIGMFVAMCVGRFMRLEKGSGMRTFMISAGSQNFGYTAVPVAEALWGSGALALLFVHNLGVEAAIWSVGVMCMSGGKKMQWRRLLNGPMIAVMAGLLLVACGLDDRVNGPFRTAISWIGVGAFPLAILITGCAMMDMLGEEKPSWRLMTAACVVRLGIAPLAILCAAKWLPISTELKQVLVVQAAMPAAMMPILIARVYGGRPAVAVQIVISTTVVSFLTLPWIISWGVKWLDLSPALP